MKIKIIRDQDTTEFGYLRVGQEIDIDKKKAALLINRGIGKDVLSNKAVVTPKKKGRK